MNELDQRRAATLASGTDADVGAVPSPRDAVSVYAAATALASALPIPLLDAALAGMARGSAMRRVAARHGVRLTREAREVLARDSARHKGAGRLLRSAALRSLARLRVAGRLERLLSVIGAALLLDHYLRTAERPQGVPITADEARRVRAASDMATMQSAMGALGSLPRASWEALTDAARRAVQVDDEDRTPAERLVDSLLDASADAQSELVRRLEEQFDVALRDGPRESE